MQAPERLGKYLIGRGAMGVVYEGYDPMIERAVAIKVLRLDEGNPELAAELRMRFRREAQAAGRLGHPGIVAVYEYGEDAAAGTTFIAMELVRGRDLKNLFDAGTRFTLEQTGRLMEELLAALQHAHARGVVHRDVKPGNIILLDGGGLKVADFGIAKLDTSELTQLGSVLGTVSHMSPEQLIGETVDGRSDLYSCGVILYQLLTGERPFTGPPASLMHKVLNEAPLPPSRRVPALPAALDAVVLKAMAKSADQRHADAATFAAELRAALAAPRPATSSAVDDEATVVMPLGTKPAAAAVHGEASTVSGVTSTRATEIARGAQGARQDATVPLPQQSDPTAAEVAKAQSSTWTSTAPSPSWTTTSASPSPSSPSASTSPSIAASAHAASARRTRRGVGAVLGVVGVALASAAGYRLLVPRSTGEPAVATSASAAFATTPLPPTMDSARAPAVNAAPMAAGPEASAPTLGSIVPISPAPIAPAPPAQLPTGEATAAPAAAPPPPVRTTAAPAAPAGSATAAAPRPVIVAAAAPATTSNPKPMASAEPAPIRPAATPPAPPPATPVALAPVSPSPPPRAATPAPSRGPETAPPSGRDARAPGDAYPAAPSNASAPARRIEARIAPGEAARTVPGTQQTPAPGAAAPPTRTDADCLEEARRGNARCQVVVGNLYRAGRGVPRDPAEAARWYRMAAEQGLDAGQYELGLLYENGLGVARDPVQAVAWYRKAAAQGHARAQDMLGRAYENGLAGPSNLVLAAEWYRKAADQNLPVAEYHLGRLYLGGRGVFKDATKGQALLQKAADAGEPNAMVYVADLYARGDGKPRDPDQANRLYREALARPGLNDRNRETAQRAIAAAR